MIKWKVLRFGVCVCFHVNELHSLKGIELGMRFFFAVEMILNVNILYEYVY